MIIKLLIHVPNHVAAAKKLAGVGAIEDIFEVGVLLCFWMMSKPDQAGIDQLA